MCTCTSPTGYMYTLYMVVRRRSEKMKVYADGNNHGRRPDDDDDVDVDGRHRALFIYPGLQQRVYNSRRRTVPPTLTVTVSSLHTLSLRPRGYVTTNLSRAHTHTHTHTSSRGLNSRSLKRNAATKYISYLLFYNTLVNGTYVDEKISFSIANWTEKQITRRSNDTPLNSH